MFGRKFYLLTTALIAGSLVTAASAADVKPAVIYDLGGKFDKSFNEGVFNGATKFSKETGVPFRDLEIQNDAQREQVLRKFAKDGFSPILMPGFAWATALGKIAEEFPNTKFAIIDAVVDKPNVQSMVFKAEESSFLVGVIAAETSKTGKVGFVGGMDIPLISAFECGYAQGVKYAKGSDEVIANMTGTTPAAWNDPVKGGELAKSQIDRGADIVYAAAGATGQGVLKAAADAGKYRHRRRLRSGQSLPRPRADLGAEAGRHRNLRVVQSGQGRDLEGRRRGVRPQERRCRLRAGRMEQVDPLARGPEGRRRRESRHHFGQDHRSRLYVGQQVPCIRSVCA